MEQEIIGIREAARRLFVSDTALHKALKSGRITPANPGEKPAKLAWPSVQTEFKAHQPPDKRKPEKAAPVAPAADPFLDLEKAEDGDGPDYYKERARRMHYQASQAQLALEKDQGLLVDAKEIELQWTKLINAAKTRILGIPAACKSRVSDLPMPALAALERVCREVLEGLADDLDK